ncbi:MAG TPA: GntR family transcriptional regulator [Acidimicrobiales bacterium]|nr:GntR family transcriptional regulator [Acidimicrobiales bacterium]
MIVDVDFALPVPPYEQIRRAITTAVGRRQLEAGTRLPTVRQLARDLEVSPATVSHAYRELERDGLVYGAGRKGTFVADAGRPAARPVPGLAREFVEQARRTGANRSAILHAVIDALGDD